MNREEYRRMYEHENNHWWYRGMRSIASSLLEDSLRQSRLPVARGAAPGHDQTSPTRSVRQPPLDILDAGCGTGAGLEWLGQYGVPTGIDLSEDALALCRERGLRRLVRGSVDLLPFPTASFDLVTSFDVLYHLWVSDAAQAMHEFHRVLRPGGRLLLRLPALEWLHGKHDVAVHTRHRYRLGEVVDEMQRAGFIVERATYVNFLLMPLVAGKRLSERWSSGAPGDLDASPPWLNRLLEGTLSLEGRLVVHTKLPLGVSVMALGRRPA